MTSLLTASDLAMIETAVKADLPNTVTVYSVSYNFLGGGFGGYALTPTLKHEAIAARVRPAGFPFVLGSESPTLTSYHLLYVAKEHEISADDYVFLGADMDGPSFQSLGQVDFSADRALNTYLLRRVNTNLGAIA